MATHLAEPFELLLRNGHVIDPGAGFDERADLGIRQGRIAAMGPELDATSCPDVRDATGTFISPGLIDLHGHWYEAGLYGINADIGLNYGVTTAVDAGTAGFANFANFRRTRHRHQPHADSCFCAFVLSGLACAFCRRAG